MIGAMPGSGEGVTADSVARDLEANKAAKALTIYLSSDGGSVTEGLAIHSQIQRYSAERDVTMYVDGRAISIGSIIALAGTRLVMPKSAMLMIHSPWAVFVGNAREARKKADDLDKMAATMRDIYASASGQDGETISKMMEEETWLSAVDAKALGFADQVLDEEPKDPRAALHSSLLDAYKNTPAGLRSLKAEAALRRMEGSLMRQRIEEQARGASAAARPGQPGQKQPKQSKE